MTALGPQDVRERLAALGLEGKPAAEVEIESLARTMALVRPLIAALDRLSLADVEPVVQFRAHTTDK